MMLEAAMQIRKKSKSILKAEERFKSAVTAYVVGLGARPGGSYDYELETPAGLLRLTVYDDWLATRFDDLARATEFTKTTGLSCNPYSGKWNFHFGDGSAASLDPDAVIPQLAFYFECLMQWHMVGRH